MWLSDLSGLGLSRLGDRVIDQPIHSPLRGVLPLTLVALAVAGATGCNTALTPVGVSPARPAAAAIQGSVYGGQQPVVGASIQLYAVGAPASGGGYGQGATALITGTLPTTDANGNFSITGDYVPPTMPSHFYIVSSGGSPGNGNPVNPNILLMSTIGGCTATAGLSPSLFLNINEVTTAASAMALRPYLAAPGVGNRNAPSVGAPSTDYQGLQNAFEMVNNLVDIATGTVVKPANNWTATAENGLRLNTLGDILAFCVNSDPMVNFCSTLFADATPSSAAYVAADTVQAASYIAANPATNVGALFNLVSPSPPFQGLTAAPADFTLNVATAAVGCQAAVSLATAGDFAVLGGSTVTSAGTTVVSGGNLGVAPGTSVTGFPAGVLTSPAVMDVSDAAAVQAQADLSSAYVSTAALAGAAVLPQDLGGLTLTPGLYRTATSAGLSGNLTLDAQGDPGAVFIVQIGTALTTAESSEVVLANGAQARNIYWAVGSSATLGSGSGFQGTIMAVTSITMNSGVTLHGRALAMNGAVTLDGDTVTAP